MSPKRDDKNLVALAGEYHVLAQLAERGIVGALTLGHTKGIDILAHNPRTGRMRRVEVKTTRRRPAPALLWHPGSAKAYAWTMSVKHEAIRDANLIYCFVWLGGPPTSPLVFVVPAADVAKYVKWEHRLWLRSRKRKPDPNNPMRQFRVEESDPHGYLDNWTRFE
jgi:hypothetical protein